MQPFSRRLFIMTSGNSILQVTDLNYRFQMRPPLHRALQPMGSYLRLVARELRTHWCLILLMSIMVFVIATFCTEDTGVMAQAVLESIRNGPTSITLVQVG